MDSDGESCNNVNIVIGSSTTTTRVWDIAVTQYSCIDTTLLENTAGPKGCLQYMTGDKNGAGRIDNFGSDPTLTTFGASVTHLANQQYNICIRYYLQQAYFLSTSEKNSWQKNLRKKCYANGPIFRHLGEGIRKGVLFVKRRQHTRI